MFENHPLFGMIQKSKQDPFFFGYYLDRLAMAHGWNERDIADAVGCSIERLHLLYLCRWPTGDEELLQIAEYVICDRGKLRALVDGSTN